MGIVLLYANIDGHRTWGRLKRAGACDFDKTLVSMSMR